MIFFVANDGTVIESVPSPVYQGSANANNIYLVAPFAANLQVTAAFKLPNGVWTTRYLMTPFAEISGVINEKTGKPYVGWQLSLPSEITQYYGTVTAQFFFYSGQGAVLTASSSTSFTVGQGVPEILPLTPSKDIYNQIIDNLSLFSQQLNNGIFTARSIYAWNSEYTYGANELVFYPMEGKYGVFLKSITDNNTAAPYVDGVLDTGNWLLETDFNLFVEMAQKTQDNANRAASNAATAAESAREAEISLSNAQAAAEKAEQHEGGAIAAFKQAAAEAIKAATSSKDAEDWAKQAAELFATHSIKISTEYETVADLPVEGNSQTIYFIPNGGVDENSYDEYVWVSSKGTYEKIGSTAVDLSGYVSKSGSEMTGTLAVPKLKVDKIARNKEQSLYVEPKVQFHSATTFDSGAYFNKSAEVRQLHLGTLKGLGGEDIDVQEQLNMNSRNIADVGTLEAGAISATGEFSHKDEQGDKSPVILFNNSVDMSGHDIWNADAVHANAAIIEENFKDSSQWSRHGSVKLAGDADGALHLSSMRYVNPTKVVMHAAHTSGSDAVTLKYENGVLDSDKPITENGERVYSPNNFPLTQQNATILLKISLISDMPYDRYFKYYDLVHHELKTINIPFEEYISKRDANIDLNTPCIYWLKSNGYESQAVYGAALVISGKGNDPYAYCSVDEDDGMDTDISDGFVLSFSKCFINID